MIFLIKKLFFKKNTTKIEEKRQKKKKTISIGFSSSLIFIQKKRLFVFYKEEKVWQNR